jgi:archaellum biogenesis ATPase FlaH
VEQKFNNDFIERITTDGVGMLFVTERYKLEEASIELLSRIKNKGFKLIYVTSSLPFKSIQEKLDVAKIEDYFIIDSVTAPVIQDPNAYKNCIFIRSPGDLTEISINLENLMKRGGENFVVIDSITSFLIYNSENEILRFIHFTSSIAREKKSKLVFIVIENKGISDAFLDKIRSFIDEEAKLE